MEDDDEAEAVKPSKRGKVCNISTEKSFKVGKNLHILNTGTVERSDPRFHDAQYIYPLGCKYTPLPLPSPSHLSHLSLSLSHHHQCKPTDPLSSLPPPHPSIHSWSFLPLLTHSLTHSLILLVFRREPQNGAGAGRGPSGS